MYAPRSLECSFRFAPLVCSFRSANVLGSAALRINVQLALTVARLQAAGRFGLRQRRLGGRDEIVVYVRNTFLIRSVSLYSRPSAIRSPSKRR
jgi:hypothetical protein